MKKLAIGFFFLVSVSAFANDFKINCERLTLAVPQEGFAKSLAGQEINVPSLVEGYDNSSLVLASKQYFVSLNRFGNTVSFDLMKKKSSTISTLIGSAEYVLKRGAVANAYMTTESGATLYVGNCVIK